MGDEIEIKYSLDNNGERYFPATHAEAIVGVELQAKGDWIAFTPLSGTPNVAFKEAGENGINCAYRSINIMGLKINSVRINMSNITNGMIIQNLPSDFTKTSQSWLLRTPAWHMPVIISLRPNGKLALSMNDNDKTNWSQSDYVYGEFTWIEIEEVDS